MNNPCSPTAQSDSASAPAAPSSPPAETSPAPIDVPPEEHQPALKEEELGDPRDWVALTTEIQCKDLTIEEQAQLQKVLADNIGIIQAHDVPAPETLKDALADPVHGIAWRDATLREMRTLHDHDVFEVNVIPAPGTRPIATRWVFKPQADGEGRIHPMPPRTPSAWF